MHQPGRPSSSTAQHVINMSGMDPGLGLMGQIGGGAPASISTTTGLTNASASSPASSSTTAAGAMAANAAMMAVNAPPGAYMASPSRQHAELHANQSPRPPGSLSPQRGGSSQGSTLPHSTSSAFTSPQRMPQYSAGLSPPSSAGTVPALNPTGQLGRSQSLGHAAYQQYQQHQQHLQQQQQQGNGSVTYQLPLSPSAADMYSQQRRDRSQQYSDSSIGNGSSTMAGASLLPTINTHIPSSSLSATSPYASPNVRQALPPLSPGAASPYGSSYVPTASSGSGRPTSMLDGAAYGNSAAGSSAYTGAQTLSPVAGSSKRASVAHMQGLDPKTTGSAGPSLLPMHHSSHMSNPYGDSSLPLYSSGAARSPSSPYMPVSPTMQPAKVGAPPRTSVGGSFSPATLNDHRMSVEVKNMAGAGMDPAHLWKERRGTLTNHDTVTNRLQLGEFDAWDRQQRAQRRRMDGFRRVRDLNDLKVNLEPAQQGKGRRADPLGGYVSPLKAMTAYLHHTYHLVNPAFFYELSFNPRRVLTKPSRPMYNDGHDNEDSDYILYVNDWLGSEESNRYLILDILGQGTFGQVVKCQNMKTREIVAVKVIKNKPAYFNQSMMEVTILEMLNGNWDPNDEHHILRLRDTFIHAKHLCLVFELLSSNLYELIKQNSFRGLSTSLVRVFTTQLLDALTVLHEARLIHCDLKPENILLKTLQTPSIKLVDFGSACHERQTVYTYIQSRFYRSPEVLLGLPYNASIDMWSLGCIAIELFLGLPLFPGTSEYNQICRIVEMLGLPPRWMLEQGKQTGEFFNAWNDEYGRRQYKLKGLDQYSREHNIQEQPSKRYFQATTLPDIVKTYPLSRKSGKPADVQKEMANRTSFIDFVSGLLSMDPNTRWTPEQAKLHPFITGEKFTQPFNPPLSPVTTIQRASIRPSGSGNSANSTSDKHPFGGLVTEGSNRSSGRTYQDAAAYNQHLAQQHAYNQAHQARQNQVNNNPYARDENPEKAAAAQANAAAAAQAQMAHAHAHAQAQAQAAQMHVAAMSPPYGQPNAEQQQHSGAGYTANRSRSNTLTRMDVIPPQLAKMGLDQPGHSMTPVLSREESLREWERQQQANAGISAGALAERQQRASGRSGAGESGKSRSDKENHHLDLLHQQAEQAHQQQAQWHQAAAASGNAAATYPSSAQVVTTGPAMSPSQLGAGASGSKSFSVMMDPQKQQQSIVGQAKGSPATAQMVAPPPPAMFANTGPRQSNNAAAGLTFDPYQSDIAQLMPALQPMQYHTIGHSAVGSPPGAAAHARVSGGSSSGIGISGSGGGNAMNRHSIAVTHMSSPHQYATGPSSGLPGSGSLANLQGLYASPTTSAADAGMHAASVQQPPPSAAASTTVNASGTRSDGFGGLSDLMFGGSGGGGASGARVMANPGLPPSSPLAAHRYSTTAAMMNGPMSPHHQQHGSGAGRAITPTRSPIDATSGLSGGGVYQSNVGGRRF